MGSHHLRDIPSARHFNCVTSHLRDFSSARHPICATFHFRDIPSVRQPICANFVEFYNLRDFEADQLAPILFNDDFKAIT